MYASIFSYRPSRERYELLGFKIPEQHIITQ
jgi:V-ATPase subunit H